MLEEVEWTKDDDFESFKEGWFLMKHSFRRPFIQKVDADEVFKTDEEAYNHVLEGESEVCKKIQPVLLRARFL